MKRKTQTNVIIATSTAIIVGVQLFVHHMNEKLNATIAAGEKSMRDTKFTLVEFPATEDLWP